MTHLLLITMGREVSQRWRNGQEKKQLAQNISSIFILTPKKFTKNTASKEVNLPLSIDLCIVSFLPHKLDSTPEEREKYLESIKETALNFRGKPFKFIWAQGGDHFEVEEKLGISGVGYPSVVAIFNSKNVFGRMKRAFSQENLQQFAT